MAVFKIMSFGRVQTLLFCLSKSLPGKKVVNIGILTHRYMGRGCQFGDDYWDNGHKQDPDEDS